MLEKIQNAFHESIQNRISVSTALPELLLNAAERIVSCLLQGNKLIVCGSGRSYLNAQLLVTNLQHRYEIARPSLAATLLSFDPIWASCLHHDDTQDQLYRKQLKIMAKSGDLLIAFSPLGNEPLIDNVLQTASNDEISVILLSSLANESSVSYLRSSDLEIRVPVKQEMRIVEEHHFCVNLLSELIDNLLFNPTPY